MTTYHTQQNQVLMHLDSLTDKKPKKISTTYTKNSAAELATYFSEFLLKFIVKNNTY